MIPASEFDLTVWCTPSYSNGEGGMCVEVGTFPHAAWRTSTYTNGEGGNCVEVAGQVPDVVPVRDSKISESPVLVFTNVGWTSLIDSVKSSARA